MVLLAELIFYVLSENVFVFEKAPWDCLQSLTCFQKVKNVHFENRISSLPPGTKEKNVLRFS